MKLQRLLDQVMAESPAASDDAQPPTGGDVNGSKMMKMVA